MIRKRIEWKLRTRTLQLGDRTLIMGVLNVTPDSFSDGGKYSEPDRAFARAIELEEQGVDIIDIGAESTRPDSQRISEAEELRRLIPVLKRLQGHINVPISVDTYKAAVAVKALEYGVEIINDPSGLTFDVQLARAAANGDAGLILNHMRGTPDMWAKLPPMKDPAGTVAAELDAAIHRARRNGVDPKRIVIDPGIGFGKRREQNSELIAGLRELERLDRGILVGPSRKQFLAQTEEQATEFATAAAVAVCILNGAHIVRVHDVASLLPAFQVADAIAAAAANLPVEESQDKKRSSPKPKTVTDVVRNAPPRPVRPELARKEFVPPPAATPAPPPAAPPQEDREVRPPAGSRPFTPRPSGPPSRDRRSDDRPSRDPRGPRGPRPDGPPNRDPRGPRGPRPDGPPNRDPRGPRGPRPDGPPSRGPRGPRPDGPPSRGPRGPRPDGPPNRGSKGPRGPRPDGPRPSGPKPRGFRPGGPRPSR